MRDQITIGWRRPVRFRHPSPWTVNPTARSPTWETWVTTPQFDGPVTATVEAQDD